MSRPLQCRIGWHDIYLDAAFFTNANRCERCQRYVGGDEGAALRRERELWAEVPKKMPGEQRLGWVASRLYGGAAAQSPIGQPS